MTDQTEEAVSKIYDVFVRRSSQHWAIRVPSLDAETGTTVKGDVVRQAQVMISELTGEQNFRMRVRWAAA